MASVPFTMINFMMKEKFLRRKLLGGQVFYQPVICANTVLFSL